MTHEVFISYSSKDRAVADAACAVLEARGLSCWIAPRDIRPGDDWSASIVRAIAQARVFVLVFTANANTSQQIKREVERAVNRGIPVLPVRIEDAAPSESLEYFISTPHWFDAFPPPFEQHLEQLAVVVETIVKGVPAAHPVPHAGKAAAVPFLRHHALKLGSAGIAALAIAIGLVAWLLLGRGADEVSFGPQCLIKVDEPSARSCATMLAQNAQWQDCASSFAQQDMGKAAARASAAIDSGDAGSALYYDPKYYHGAYGTISHYWEKLGQCVNDGYLPFAQLSGGAAFPQYFWSRTHGVRQTFLSNWQGKNAPLPDFMSNFQSLCLRYKADRNKVRPGSGDALDCSL